MQINQTANSSLVRKWQDKQTKTSLQQYTDKVDRTIDSLNDRTYINNPSEKNSMYWQTAQRTADSLSRADEAIHGSNFFTIADNSSNVPVSHIIERDKDMELEQARKIFDDQVLSSTIKFRNDLNRLAQSNANQ